MYKMNIENIKKLICNPLFLSLYFFVIINGYSQVPANYVLMYEEEFNNNILNENEWYYRDQDELVHGGYNQMENVSVETTDGIGYLKIQYNQWDVNEDGVDDIVGGGIMTKKAFGYGYYEAKIKFYDDSKGFHQSFWSLGLGTWLSYSDKYTYNEDGKNDLVPRVNSTLEIDGIELDSDHNTAGSNFHWHRPVLDTPIGSHGSYDFSYLDTSSWIVVSYEWKPGTIIYYINGIERHRFNYNDDRYAPQEVWLTGLANNTSYFGGGGIPLPGANMKVDYFRYYNRPVNTNLIGNNSFELNNANSRFPYNWVEDDGVYDNSYFDPSKVVYDETAYQGNGYLMHESQTSSNGITTKSILEGIPNGKYKLSAWVQSSGGLQTAKMDVFSPGGIGMSIEIPNTNVWTQIIIDDILIVSNKAEIHFTSNGSNGQWVKIDNVSFVESAALNTQDFDRVINSFKLYPNPVKDVLNFEISLNNKEKIDVSIFSIEGNCVLKKMINGDLGVNLLGINTDNFSPGVYIIRIKFKSESISRKIIIKP